MARYFRRVRDDGLSLRPTFILMFIISLGITGALLLMSYHTIRSYHALSEATDNFIELQDAADSLLKASDYLTDEAQCYTVLGERRHLDNYFTEARINRRREEAIEVMKDRVPDSAALRELENAMQDSLTLMNLEYYAMLLQLSAQGDANIPEPMRSVMLSKEDQALSPEEKNLLSQRLLHDGNYYEQKNRIRSDLERCVIELKEGTHGTQAEMEKRMHADLIGMTVLIVIQSLSLILMLWLSTSLGINPVLQAVEHIKNDQKLPIIGAHEFRYLAGTYNKMYTAYKRSIDNLSFKASHDELTGVYNRAGFDLIRQSVNLETTAFLLFDADKFKNVNDSYGHETGDRILQKLASALKQNFRSDDYVCRIGGDEFLVVMVHVNRNIRRLIEKKVIRINRHMENTEDGLPPISVSVGVSLCRKGGNPQEMFREADTALYFVKEHGRDGCCFYDEKMKKLSRQDPEQPSDHQIIK